MLSLYLHSIQTETPLAYIGITKRKWFTRLAEHESHAARGSRYLFHSALREHSPNKNILHHVLLTGINEETALQLEEEFVENTLYPVGLNMIPGGKAGLKYLASLGLARRTTESVDMDIASIMDRPTLEGRPNPLCSARWENDPDYVTRVICGHSGRLTVEQIQMTRALAITGRSAEQIKDFVKAKNVAQVQRVLKGRTYARIA